jgi:superfamily I DNA/RNA helicase
VGPEPFAPDREQRRVLDHERGPLLVTGAAGTGKTAVLRERFARLIEEGADPERTVLVVGSRRARDNAMSFLFERLGGTSLPSLRVTTVHGLAFHIVNLRYEALGYAEPPTLLDASDQFSVVREMLLGELRRMPNEWRAYRDLLPIRGFADQVRQFVLRAGEALLPPNEIERKAERRGLSGWKELAAFYRRYLDALGARDAVDFPGLIQQAAVAATAGDTVFDHVLVDDYQDATLGAELLLTDLHPRSLVVAGNLAAHVFSFQGTTDRPLRRFPERTRADHIELVTPHRGTEVSIEAWRAPHSSEEHAAAARELRRIHIEEDVRWRDLAVVVRRQDAHLAGLLRALDDARIPRTSAGSVPSLRIAPATFPYVLALRWLVANEDERNELIEPVLTSELGCISPAAARALLREARAAARPPAMALEMDGALSDEERASLEGLRSALAHAQERRASVLDAFAILWRELPYSRRLVAAAEDPREAGTDLDAVLAFARAVDDAGGSPDASIESFLAAMEVAEGGPELAAPGERSRDAVQILTAHATSGLEFHTVIVVGAVEGDFPSLARPEPMFDLALLEGARSRSETMRDRLADERRLFEMVLARARRRVVLTASEPHGERSSEGIPSRFVEDMGIPWREAPTAPFPSPLSVDEAAGAWRRTLADPRRPAPQRLAALEGLLALGVDPTRWWFQRDWSDAGHPAKERLHLSFSRLDDLENCELRYALAHDLGLDPGSGYQAWVGKLVHGIIEDCDAGRIERRPDAFIAALRDRWQPERFPSLAVSEMELDHAIRVLVPNWFERYGSHVAEATEQRFRFQHEGAVISGIIDRIGTLPEGGRWITDYKTGRADKAPKAKDSLQLGIYYLAVGECAELAEFRPIEGVELAYLAGKKGQEQLVTLSWPVAERAEDDYEMQMRERLSGLVETVRRLNDAGRYTPSTKADCFFCRFQTLCSRYPQGGEVFPIPSAPGPDTQEAP